MLDPLGIGGVWLGEFSYSPNAEASVPEGSRHFRMEARAGWFGRFRGSIEDDPASGISVLAQARGRIAGQKISFVKRYPLCYVNDGRRAVPLRDYLASEHRLEIDFDVPSTRIFYVGQYEPSNQSVRGTWRLDGEPLRFRCNGVWMSLDAGHADGTWLMRRHPFD